MSSRRRRGTSAAPAAKASGASAAAAPDHPLRALFSKVDVDGSGEIDAAELVTAMAGLGESISARQAEAMMAGADQDGNGTLDVGEFIAVMTSGVKDDLWEKARGGFGPALAEFKASISSSLQLDELHKTFKESAREATGIKPRAIAGVGNLTADGKEEAFQTANLKTRLVAGLISWAVPLGATCLWQREVLQKATETGCDPGVNDDSCVTFEEEGVWFGGMLLLLFALTNAIFFVGGQDLGKFVVGLQVVDSDGQPLGLLAMLVRTVFLVCSTAITLGLGLLAVVFNADGRTLADLLMAPTFVVYRR